MTEEISNNNSAYPSVRETIRKFNMYEKSNGYLSIPIKSKNHTPSSSSSTDSTSVSTATSDLQSNRHQRRPSISLKSPKNTEHIESISVPIYSSPTVIYKELQVPMNNSRSNSIHNNFDDIGLEIIESIETHESIHGAPSTIAHYEQNDIQRQQRKDIYPRLPPPLPPVNALPNLQDDSNYSRKRTLPSSNFVLEIGALVVVFILCMVLVLAIREEQVNLRTTIQVVYTYVYLISIIWMIWCTYDIIKFRQQWTKLTSSADNQSEYMYIVEHYPHNRPYFPDIHNTGGLFMRVGAGLLCMGSLVITVIELAKTVEIMRTNFETRETHVTDYSQSVFVTKSITYIFRFLFHCVQFTFLFRYGNIIIDRYHFIAKIGLVHIIIANFCTWFEAIVIETLEELHKQSAHVASTKIPVTFNTTTSGLTSTMINFFKAASAEESSSQNTTKSVLEFIENIQSIMLVYLYPCLIEYSLICVTVFYIMWRNVGKKENRSFLHFGARHIFTINCSRASCGLLLGGIVFLLTISTLLPAYILDLRSAIFITHITEFVLLFISLIIICISFIYTTKLYYDQQAHVDIFDQILILITTVGNFAYSFFDLFASIFIQSYTIDIPRFIEIIIGTLAIFQTFLQSAFILDALKRRAITRNEIRNKPGRELITALLLINLAIWLHDSISAKKVKLNPLQSEYYDPGTWSIVQAFTSPLSIFYRFHSSVCLADIWQEVYHDHRNDRANHSIRRNNSFNNQH